jgi:hypothetical protein
MTPSDFQQRLQAIEDAVGGTKSPPNAAAFPEEEKLRYEVEQLRWAVGYLAKLLRLHLRPISNERAGRVRRCGKAAIVRAANDSPMSGHVALRTPAWANRPTVERDPALAWLYATGPVNLRDPGTRQSAPNDVNMPGIEHEDLVMPRLRDWLEQQDPKLSLKAATRWICHAWRRCSVPSMIICCPVACRPHQ